MSNRAMSPAMIRELRSIAATGEPTDPAEWHADRALRSMRGPRQSALLRRLLIADLPEGPVDGRRPRFPGNES